MDEQFGRSILGVMFDMDGVLVDSERLHVQADAETFRRYGLEIPPDAWTTIFGMKSEDGLQSILERYGTGKENVERLAREKRNRYFELAEDGLDLIPGAKEYVLYCRGRSLRTAVVTSGKAYYQLPFLERMGVLSLFDAVVTGDEVSKGKPDPEAYLLASSRLGISPARCLVIEDADNGIRSAKAAGCKAIGITTTLSRETLLSVGADLVVDGFRELYGSDGSGLTSFPV